jgi:hypothetical protein
MLFTRNNYHAYNSEYERFATIRKAASIINFTDENNEFHINSPLFFLSALHERRLVLSCEFQVSRCGLLGLPIPYAIYLVEF